MTDRRENLNTAATFGGLFGPSITDLVWFRFADGRDGRLSDVLAAAGFRRGRQGVAALGQPPARPRR
jgi:hypothetical protein